MFGSGRIEWKRLRPCHLQSFIAQYGRNGRVGAAQAAAVALRSLLRWLQFRGRTAPNLVGAVPRFPRWRLATLPTVMTDDQLRIFLASFDQSPRGRQNYVMALCMTDLGLRAAEVADLLLDDMDEAAGTLRLSASKSRRERVLPMSHRLRLAVIDYVRRHRPKTDNRRLFVRHRVPVRSRDSRAGSRGDAAGLRVSAWLRELDGYACPAPHGGHATTSCRRGLETGCRHPRSPQH